MRKKIAQFFVFLFWAYIVLGVYFLVRFFIPPVPSNFLWLLPLFLTVAIITVNEVDAGNFLGENAAMISAVLVGVFSVAGPPPDSSLAVSSLFVAFGMMAIGTVMVLFFLRKKDPWLPLIKLTYKWIFLVAWSVWLGLSMNHIVTGSGLRFFVDSMIVGLLCSAGGIILMIAILILREFVKFLIWLHRYAFSRLVKA